MKRARGADVPVAREPVKRARGSDSDLASELVKRARGADVPVAREPREVHPLFDSHDWEKIMNVMVSKGGLLLQGNAGNGKSYVAKHKMLPYHKV